ncbi:MAG: pyroglutamyl-peptidase [Myxococcota bacterium]|jgi:pyroglutamyl-peptidase
MPAGVTSPETAPAAKKGTLLVTGFGPFLDVTDNVSGLLAGSIALHHPTYRGHRVEATVLPVTYAEAERFALDVSTRDDVVAWLAFGVARTDTVRLECQARNTIRSRAPDAAGVVLDGEVLIDGAQSLLTTSLPLDQWSALLDDAGQRVVTSIDPGGYICNALYFRMLTVARDRYPAIFIHIPAATTAQNLPRLRRLAVQVMAQLTATVV